MSYITPTGENVLFAMEQDLMSGLILDLIPATGRTILFVYWSSDYIKKTFDLEMVKSCYTISSYVNGIQNGVHLTIGTLTPELELLLENAKTS